MARPRPSRLLRALEAALAAPGAPGPDEHLLVAVSGGPDSTALLAGLAALAPERGWRLTAAHVAHGLRGAESEADRARVAELAARLGAGHVERRATVAPGPDLEARARHARHRTLVDLAAAAGATRIVLAHTADDQAETVLLRLLRGTGRGGLGGMRPARGRLWRPLLAVPRSDVRRFLAEEGLEAAVDRSNADLRHARNRLRSLLVPLLQSEWNPALVPALVALAERLRDEDGVLEALARDRLAAASADDGLDAQALAAMPPGLARRVIRRWLERGERRSPAAAHVERALALARGTLRGAVAVPGPARVLRAGARLVRRAGRTGGAAPFEAAIAPGAAVVHPAAGWRLRLAAPRERAADDPCVPDAAHAVFDAERLPAPLRLRSPRPGDRIALPGVGTRKVQDVLVDARVPREDRPGVALLDAGGTVAWIAGVARGSAAMLRPDSRCVIAAVLERMKPAPRCPSGDHMVRSHAFSRLSRAD